jgi:AraC-like DNA-binding protein
MSQTQTFILAIGGLQGFLLFALLVSDKRVNYASKLLGVYCLFLASTLLLPLIVVSGEVSVTWLIGFLLFLPASYGSISYLYCRSAMTGEPLQRYDVIHLLPLLICYSLNYEILFSAEKALNFVRMPKHIDATLKLTLAVFYGQALLYAALLARMIHRYQTKSKQTLSSYNPDTFRWHWSLVVFMVSIWGLKALSGLTSNESMVNLIADCLLVFMIYFFAVVQWRNPSLFHIQQLSAELAQPTVLDNKRLAEGLLDQETRSSVLSLVQDQVKEQALYRNSELTLAALAEQVGVSVHHLSETLNQYGGKNFNRFINEYRVAEVCQQLDQKSDRKLIDLALDAGFSSKSSFNAIFKKLTGQTPSLYRRQPISQ